METNPTPKKPPLVELFSPVVTSFRHVSKPWGAYTTVTGFAGDFLKPSADIAPYFIIASTISFLISLLFFRRKAKKEGLQNASNSKLGGVTAFSFLSIIGWTLLFLFYHFTPPQGVAAAYIPGLAELQKKILKLEQDISEIKKTTAQLDEKINLLAKNGTIIPNPQDAAEFYHNAKFYELNGNSREAIQSYAKFLELEPSYVDPNEDYQTLLQNTEGKEATQKIYQNLQTKFSKNPIVQLMTIRLNPNLTERLKQLQSLSKQYPAVGPIYFELAETYLQSGEGNTSVDSIRGAKSAFDQFKKVDEKGEVKKYFLDKRALEKFYQRISAFEKRVKGVYQSILEKPFVVQLNFKKKWIEIFMVPYEKNVQKVFYSIDRPNPNRDTGNSSIKDPLSGKLIPNFGISGKLQPGKHTLYLKYINSEGKESEVIEETFEIPFIASGYSLSPENDLVSRSVTYRIWFASMSDQKYRYFYQTNPHSKFEPLKGKTEAEDSITFDVTLPSGPQEISYYGESEKGRTPTYHLKLDL